MPHKIVKNILITGCSHDGIGYDSAVLLREKGYEVYATCRQEDDCKKLRDEGFISFQLDYSDENSINEAAQQALEYGKGSIDVLFNNGAYGLPAKIEDLPTDALRDLFEVNFFGWHHLTRLLLPSMKQRNFGYIIQNSSVLGMVALTMRGAYTASKFALEGLTDTLRLELYDSNIHIVLVQPGPITTKFRFNSYKKFQQYIHRDNVLDKSAFDNLEKALQQEGTIPFNLPARAVSNKVLKIIETPNPKPRYYVTFITYLFGYAKRFLSSKMLDRILKKI